MGSLSDFPASMSDVFARQPARRYVTQAFTPRGSYHIKFTFLYYIDDPSDHQST